jgi:integrase
MAEHEAEQAKAEADAAKAKAAAMTYSEVADMFIAVREAGWREPKHRQQWRNTLDQYVLPVIGGLPVGEIETGHITRIIGPMWQSKTQTMSRVRGRVEAVLDYARTQGWRSGENPARWKGYLEFVLPRAARVRRVDHLAALDWRELAPFMARLVEQPGAAALALRFALLTACRSGEVLGARWDEVSIK